jgi:NADPH:quinone reductase-like Zn-dependent oxidoreductase
MNCLLLESEGTLPVWSQQSDPALVPSAVRVQISAAALNHRDVWMTKGLYPGVVYPVIPGSDGTGIVVECSPGTEEWAGREVIINPSYDWGTGQRVQGPEFTILGMPRPGTFAEQIIVPVTQLAPKPPHLTVSEAAALPLAGLTAYRALFSRAQLQPGERVLVTGIGGGVALFALQFAVAIGARVAVTSSSPEKISRAKELGAEAGFLYTETEWPGRVLQEFGAIQVAIDGAGGAGYLGLIEAAEPGARIVNYGGTGGNPPSLPIRKVFWNQLSLLGSTMGSPTDFASMTDLVQRHNLRPVVDEVLPMAEGAKAFQKMDAGGQFGKLVLTTS